MIDNFLRYLRHEKRVSPHTLVAYHSDLAQFSEFLNTNYPDTTIVATEFSMVRGWIVSLVELGVGATSVNRKIACLRTFFKFLLRNNHLERDPMAKVRILKGKKKLPDFVRESDMVGLLDNVEFEQTLDGLREQLILELLYSTGMRLSELISLEESRIDVRNCTIKVKGKRNKERVIPFPSGIVQLIESYRKIRNSTLTDINHNYLLTTNGGKPLYPAFVYRVVRGYLERYTSVDRKSPHVLRHTYATHLLNKGAEINAVKDLLGHTSLAATQVYTHNSIEKLKTAYQKAHPKA